MAWEKVLNQEYARNARNYGFIHARPIITLRWIAILGQTSALLFSHFILNIPLPLHQSFVVVGASVFLNVFAMLQHRRGGIAPDEAVGYLSYDTLQLTALLYLTGGPANPFLLLLIVPPVVAASFLNIRRALIVAGTVLISLILLYHHHIPLRWEDLASGEPTAFPGLYTEGHLIAIMITAGFMMVYINRISAARTQMARALSEMELKREKNRRLTALAGQAAASVHSLGSPLSTISIVVRDLASSPPSREELQEDLGLIESELDRCREILTAISRANEPDAQFQATDPVRHVTYTPMTFLNELIRQSQRPRENLDVRRKATGPDPEPEMRPTTELYQVLANFVQNAYSFADREVILQIEWDEAWITLRICDDGPGFSPSVLTRLGEPFISRRINHKEGMGLGIFIAVTILEDQNAQVDFRNLSQGGAEVRITWPRDSIDSSRG